MPTRDGTGPFSQGPMTGRGRGNCVAPVGTQLFSNGRNGNRGRGRRAMGLGLGLGLGCLRYLANAGLKNATDKEAIRED